MTFAQYTVLALSALAVAHAQQFAWCAGKRCTDTEYCYMQGTMQERCVEGSAPINNVVQPQQPINNVATPNIPLPVTYLQPQAACVDDNGECPTWKALGECNPGASSFIFTTQHCPFSCGLCNQP